MQNLSESFYSQCNLRQSFSNYVRDHQLCDYYKFCSQSTGKCFSFLKILLKFQINKSLSLHWNYTVSGVHFLSTCVLLCTDTEAYATMYQKKTSFTRNSTNTRNAVGWSYWIRKKNIRLRLKNRREIDEVSRFGQSGMWSDRKKPNKIETMKYRPINLL